MNENTPERQLTRRELRELAAQQAAQTTGEYTDTATTGFAVHAEPGYTAEQLRIVEELTAAVQVSRVTAAGTELSRREYRAAREAEYQRLLAEWEAENGPLAAYGVPVAADADATAAFEPVAAVAVTPAAAEDEDTATGAAEAAAEVAPTPQPAVEENTAVGVAGSGTDVQLEAPTALAEDAAVEAEPVVEPVAVGHDGGATTIEGADSGAAVEEIALETDEVALEADDVAPEANAFDAELPATQAFSVAELAEAAGAAEASEAAASAESNTKKRLWPWGKKDKEQQPETAAADAAAAEEEADIAAAVVADVTGADSIAETAETAEAPETGGAVLVDQAADVTEEAAEENAGSVNEPELLEAELVADPEPEVTVFTTENEVIVPAVEEAQVAAEAEIVAGDAAADDADADSATATPESVEYSFPDIAPLDEEVSVFDAGSNREMSATTGFDALINRAVEEETSASVTSGTAALILPTLPEEAVLKAALDEESGVFVSGSIQLPQSVGETGGHHSLHGSDAGEKEVLDEIFETSSHTQPVSALRAVSSQHAQVTQMLAETKKDDSKAPLVFMITGGALVVAAGAVVVAALNGMFG
ncbi:hypothetical protein EII31_00920 [Leucobacter sp. OH2974_COT-288]|nr:hypothetical protein EII31_00920 [Leucobacter sp. OH2974_COT-288]